MKLNLFVKSERDPGAIETMKLNGDSLADLHEGTILLTTPVVAVVLSAMAMLDKPWPVMTTAVGDCAAGSVLWRFRGQLMMTVVAKASFELALDRTMTRIAPEPIQRTERQDGGVMSSVRRACELAPQLRWVDVTMNGFAHPPHEGVKEMPVRLAIQREGGVLLDRVVFAVGAPDPSTGGRLPLKPVSLGYERAFGGIGHAENPLGVGFGANAEQSPNLVDPRNGEAVAALSPLPTLFPVRKHLLGGSPRISFNEVIVEIPEELDWDYFQSAPRAQRIESLAGGDWLTLEGVFPGGVRVQSQLPQVSATARIYGVDTNALGLPEELALRLDMLHVDAEEGRCHLVWRGSFPVDEALIVGGLTLAVAVESTESPVHWPEAPEMEADAITCAPPASLSPHALMGMDATMAADPAKLTEPPPFEGTIALGAIDRATPGHDHAPFMLSRPSDRTGLPAIPGAPWASESTAADRTLPTGVGESTVALGHHDGKLDELEEERRRAEVEQSLLQRLERDRREAEERRAADEAARLAKAEAEERQRAAEEKFRIEQIQAELHAKKRAEELALKRREKSDDVKRKLYGAFRKKG